MSNEHHFQSSRAVNRGVLFRQIQQLQTSREHRQRLGCFFAEGIRNFLRATEAGFPILQIIYCERLLKSPTVSKQIRLAKGNNLPCLSVKPEQFRHLSRSLHASGIAFVAASRWSQLSEIQTGKDSCWTILESVRNPGNLGTLIRSSEAFGADGFILLGTEVEPFDPTIVRTSMGSIFSQKFIRTSLAELELLVSLHQFEPIGTSPVGSVSLPRVRFPKPTLLFLGEERRGLSPTHEEFCHQMVRIPMAGQADSLNLGVAGSLLLYASATQRQET